MDDNVYHNDKNIDNNYDNVDNVDNNDDDSDDNGDNDLLLVLVCLPLKVNTMVILMIMLITMTMMLLMIIHPPLVLCLSSMLLLQMAKLFSFSWEFGPELCKLVRKGSAAAVFCILVIDRSTNVKICNRVKTSSLFFAIGKMNDRSIMTSQKLVRVRNCHRKQ